MLKLARDYIFHQVNADGSPSVDFGFTVDALNKLDAGSSERVLLSSRQEDSLLVVTYADLHRALNDSFDELFTKRHPNERPPASSRMTGVEAAQTIAAATGAPYAGVTHGTLGGSTIPHSHSQGHSGVPHTQHIHPSYPPSHIHHPYRPPYQYYDDGRSGNHAAGGFHGASGPMPNSDMSYNGRGRGGRGTGRGRGFYPGRGRGGGRGGSTSGGNEDYQP